MQTFFGCHCVLQHVQTDRTHKFTVQGPGWHCYLQSICDSLLCPYEKEQDEVSKHADTSICGLVNKWYSYSLRLLLDMLVPTNLRTTATVVWLISLKNKQWQNDFEETSVMKWWLTLWIVTCGVLWSSYRLSSQVLLRGWTPFVWTVWVITATLKQTNI